MSDYRYQIVEHNGIECLKVMIDGPEYDANGVLKCDSEGNEIIQTYIPTDDILASLIKAHAQKPQKIIPAGEGIKIVLPARLSDEMLEQIRAVVREEIRAVTLREMRWEELERLEAHFRQRKCKVCGKIPLEALLPAVIFAGMDDYLVKYPLCKCDVQLPDDGSTDGISPDGLVTGTIFKDGKPTALGRQLIDETKRALARDSRINSSINLT